MDFTDRADRPICATRKPEVLLLSAMTDRSRDRPPTIGATRVFRVRLRLIWFAASSICFDLFEVLTVE